VFVFCLDILQTYTQYYN